MIPWDHSMSWGIWSLSLVIPIVTFALLIWVLWRVANRPSGHAPKSSALQILEERYARGEISREEFLERRTVLQQTLTNGPL